jgi:N-methylhydantoinase A/oxoprolinase/acetone carboxylase beta subunit
LRARDLIESLGRRPVTLSSELSAALDAPRRALTAALNARLIGRISALISAVKSAIDRHGIAAPLMITRGDGTLAVAAKVAQRPIETVLSGPAASLVGAAALSGLTDFILTDMGGTTTDLALLVRGRPIISSSGAEIGGWRTMVRAIDVSTVCLGGDSKIAFGLDGTLLVGPERAVPISLIAERFPEVIDQLDRELADEEAMSAAGRFVMLPLGLKPKSDRQLQLSVRETQLMALISERPKPVRQIAVSSGAERSLKTMVRKGLVQIAAFTPSDAAHVIDLQSNWSREAAFRAAWLAARSRAMKTTDSSAAEALCREVWSETVRLSARAILKLALAAEGDRLSGGELIIDAVCRGAAGLGLTDIRMTPRIPVVAVGGPVKVYYPEAARRIGCEIVFPEHWAVANAVGAASGVVALSVTVEISGDGNGGFRVYLADGVVTLASGLAAVALAEERARAAATVEARNRGALKVEVTVSRDLHFLPDAVDENGLFEGRVTAEAVGRPW